MTNPYRGRPDYTFWRQGVSDNAASGVDPVVSAPFSIGPDDLIATAGSCFAQHISRTCSSAACSILSRRPSLPNTA